MTHYSGDGITTTNLTCGLRVGVSTAIVFLDFNNHKHFAFLIRYEINITLVSLEVSTYFFTLESELVEREGTFILEAIELNFSQSILVDRNLCQYQAWDEQKQHKQYNNL